jgi:hypothetical protein
VKPWLKILLISLGIIIIIPIVASIILTQLYSNKLKQILVEELNEQLLTKVEINGEASIAFWESFPMVSLEIKNVVIYGFVFVLNGDDSDTDEDSDGEGTLTGNAELIGGMATSNDTKIAKDARLTYDQTVLTNLINQIGIQTQGRSRSKICNELSSI